MGKRLELRKENLIGKGCYGEVYDIGNDKVVKAFFCKSGSIRNGYQKFKKEFEVGKELHKAGINCPKNYGIVRVSKGKEKGLGIIMDKINGETLVMFDLNASREEYGSILNMRRNQIYLAEEKGFYLIDRRNPCNTLVGKEGKVYLIDFDGCESPIKNP